MTRVVSRARKRPTTASPVVLTINGGSSSIRFAAFEASGALRLRLRGKIDRIGSSGTRLVIDDTDGTPGDVHQLSAAERRSVVPYLLSWLESQPIFSSVRAVGHRIVFGMKHSEPERITPKLIAELHRMTPYDRDHLPRELCLIEAFARRHPALRQVACFDTAFHREMPRVAKMLPIPRRYAARGIERYGFHGLSYTFLMQSLGRADAAAASGRVILAHLGNGASLAAVRDGKSVDTSMGFTPSAGLMMSSRTGDLDPGLPYIFARTEGMTAARFQKMVTHESGLLGVSGTSSDMQDLLARERHDARAAEAIALFCYQAKKWIGAYAAALGGLDTLVFTGGIGENAPTVRERICEGLDFLGVQLDESRNARTAAVISSRRSRVTVRVMRTDEEVVIAGSVCRLLGIAVSEGPAIPPSVRSSARQANS
jgi:acetate kinase